MLYLQQKQKQLLFQVILCSKNEAMVDACPSFVLVFWDKKSLGSLRKKKIIFIREN